MRACPSCVRPSRINRPVTGECAAGSINDELGLGDLSDRGIWVVLPGFLRHLTAILMAGNRLNLSTAFLRFIPNPNG